MKCAQICGSGCRHCQVHFLPGCVNLLLSAKYFNALSIHIKQELRKLPATSQVYKSDFDYSIAAGMLSV